MTELLNIKVLVLICSLLVMIGGYVGWVTAQPNTGVPAYDNTAAQDLRDADRAARHATLKAAGVIR